MSNIHHKLFGTDGVRGVANQEPMTSETALRLGRALAFVFRNSRGRHRRILIGKDTRLSGYMIETALESGICSMGVDVWLVGPLPTPGIAFLTRSMRADAGVVISASHNPFQDNGIKFFSREGFKLDDETECRIEDLVFDDGELGKYRARADDIGKAARIEDALGRYLVFLKNCLPRSLTFEGLKIAIDCANGAAYRVGPEALEELGADVLPMAVDPDGKNINLDCGAVHLDAIRKKVIADGANVGIALDGDGDRVMLIDERGGVFDGDDIMALLARSMAAEGRLAGNTVVATVMSNFGLELALREAGLKLVRTEVGDPAVAREMRQNSYNLGGEQSGHVILMDHSTTGDGLISAMLVLAQMAESGKPLSELRAMHRVPQVLENVPVKDRVPLAEMPKVQRLIEDAEHRLAGNGRLLVRYSGTEMLARVMVEGEDAAQIKTIAHEIGDAIKHHAGAR
ncbi:MAG: phosphoglucosamine mutase [Candidatus Binatus sp.]|uniref:phosphoglucosamine mutase n=1 Tax=Candidatus Binatus sp. TaxID=2811406 RepID=UPI0027270CEC|nr:phosphoglucosamine mutase [Candidatus Binatus sp.]MDO8434828.1 phosphoglucosamine mutase [Candidatus Binatus sp.]